jgi:ABC-type sugar transport system ATPase subunit
MGDLLIIEENFSPTWLIQVLDGINLEIESGEIVSILGQSGSGKTTLLNLILGLDEPSGGEIFFNNQFLLRSP